MKTKEQWYQEWCDLTMEIPFGYDLTEEQRERALEMIKRREAVHDWMYGRGPEPPDEWQPTHPATREERDHWRRAREKAWMEESKNPPGDDCLA